ncbi:hypothetical protein CXF86_15390 [Shewanella sp. GutCb]|nr:hypothetical protein CXF86_15390 [Shewanella sp. GutCb]
MEVGEQFIDRVFVIESLRDGDMSTGLEIKNNIENSEPKLNVTYCNYIDKDIFLQGLSDIYDEIKPNEGILLFIEVHGSKEGIELGGEFVSWDVLTKHLQLINTKSLMGLAVVFSCCYGVHFYRQTSILGRSPYYVMFGVDNSIYENRLLNMNKELVKGFFAKESLVEIVQSANSHLNIHDINLTFLEAGDLLIGAFTNYFTHQLSTELLLARFEETYETYLNTAESTLMTHSQYKDYYFKYIFNYSILENGFNDLRDKFLMTDLDGTLYERFYIDFNEVYDKLNAKDLIEKAKREVFA